jgi:hypothetical protein
MFNLLMAGGGWEESSDRINRSRVLEHTERHLVETFLPNNVLDADAVTDIPTLFASETRYDNSQDSARVGRITRVRLVGSDYQLDYAYDDVPPIPNSILKSLQGSLGIEDWEFNRTHWAIKDVDLFKVLFKSGLVKGPQPKVFSLGAQPIDANLVSVMMPFGAGFTAVYSALQAAASTADMTCQRADDIWVHDHIIQDVVTLIARSSVVICDLTGRNPNVFYEMGIAHTLGREVIMITQAAGDVPFDVAHIRHVRYLANNEGLAQLSQDVGQRLATLRGAVGRI